MTWWKYLLGFEHEPTPSVRDAIDAAQAANDSTNRSMRAVQHYWARQRRASDRLMDEYQEADEQRTRNDRK